MQDLIRPDASFTPRELFARMQGAWFEPRQGSMWQENTGITPTTSGGQTIGLLLGLDQQQQFGPELVTNGTFDTNITGWSVRGNATVTRSTTYFPDGSIKISVVNGDTGATQTLSGLTIGKLYEVSALAYAPSANGVVNGAVISLAATPNVANALSAQVTAEDVQQRLVIKFFATTTSYTLYLYCLNRSVQWGYNGDSAYFDSISVREILGNHASQATAANRPTLQYNGNLPLIRFNSNNVLTASLPAINVRRNLLLYSSDLTQWPSLAGTVRPAIVGSRTCFGLTSTAGAGFAFRVPIGSCVVTAGSTYTISLIVANGTLNNTEWMSVDTQLPASGQRAWFNVVTGAVGTKQSNVLSHSITALESGWYLYTVTAIAATTSARFYLSNTISDNTTTQPTDGDGVKPVAYIFGAQLELGSVATEYQKITDWTSEAYSSSGSTYFSTPQGMSCLHNQSIGTIYNLPAPQTDNYCTVITPARLAPPLEQRLALYMHRLAGLADADFFWQEQATDGMTGQLLADDGTILLRD